MGRKKVKNNAIKNWVVVRFIDDNVLFLCPSKSIKKKIVIGNNYYVTWKDGYKYLAKVVQIGAKNDLETYINTSESISSLQQVGPIDGLNTTSEIVSDSNENSLNFNNDHQVLDKYVIERSTEEDCTSNDLPISICDLNIKESLFSYNTNDALNTTSQIVSDSNVNSLDLNNDHQVLDKYVIERSIEEDCKSSVLPVSTCDPNIKVSLFNSNSNDDLNITSKIVSDSNVNSLDLNNDHQVLDKYVIERSIEEDCKSSVLPVSTCDPNIKVSLFNSNSNDDLNITSKIVSDSNVNSLDLNNDHQVLDKYVIERSIEEDCKSSVLPVSTCDPNIKVFLFNSNSNDDLNITSKIVSDSNVNSLNLNNDHQVLDKYVFERSTEEDCKSSVFPVSTCDTNNELSLYNYNTNDGQQNTLPINDFDILMKSDVYNIENEVFSNSPVSDSTSECNLDILSRYSGLRSKKLSHTYEDFNSDSSLQSDCDSTSDYIPPNEIKGNDTNSDSEISCVSEINFDNSVENNSMDQNQPSTSQTINNKSIQINKAIELSQMLNKRFNPNLNVETSKKKQINNKRHWDKKNTCIYCEKDVTNFTRHLIRNHTTEIEVARYISLPKGSKERAKLSNNLRNRGNFLGNLGNVKAIKPARRPNAFSRVVPNASDYLPCKYCYGMYKKKYLHRHEKQCDNAKIKLLGRNNAQADAQNLLLAFSSSEKELVEIVFPRMVGDNVSFVAKSDELIKAFGSRYLKNHKEKHLINVISQKMRTLARLLIQMKNEEPSIETLIDCLAPKYFDTIIKCTKIVAGYDSSKDSFGAPSIVLKIGHMLKQCCDIAEFNILKQCKNLVPDEAQSKKQQSIINMRSVIEKQWSYEVSTNASKEILQKKWNKPAFLPLTSDIQIFRNHLINVQHESINELKNNPNNVDCYKNLQESILAQLILLNRRRSGEVQRIFLDTYLTAPTEISQEEVEMSLSEMERQLTKQFKRIVIRGKRGRGVPILFTPAIQKSIQFLLKIRAVTDLVKKDNPYLFALPYSENCVRGSDAIRKLSINSGVKNPENITSTRLRKQVATISQLLNLSETDVEQLSTFLGHSKEVHAQFYRLSESAFQVAKVGKLLLMLEKGNGHEFRGKSLDDININVDALVSDIEDDHSSDENIPLEKPIMFEPKKVVKNKKVKIKKQTLSKIDSDNEINNDVSTSTQGSIVKPKKFMRVIWSEAEKKATTIYFQKHIFLKKAPNKEECQDLKRKFPELFQDKPWKKIKTYVYNTYNSRT